MKKLFSILLLASVASVSAQVNRTYFDEIYLGEKDPFPRKVKMRASVSSVGAADDYYENRIKRFNRGYGFGYDRIHNFRYDAVTFGRLDRHCVHTSFYFPGHLHTPHCAFHHNHFVPVYVQVNPKVYTRGVRGSGILGSNSGVGNRIINNGRSADNGRGRTSNNYTTRSRVSIQNINTRVATNRVNESIMTGYSRPATSVRNFDRVTPTRVIDRNPSRGTVVTQQGARSMSPVYRETTSPVRSRSNRSSYSRINSTNSRSSYSRQPSRSQSQSRVNNQRSNTRTYSPTRSSSSFSRGSVSRSSGMVRGSR
ncbi:MAG: hypothetical protein N4A45_09415 [Flavobacteriales bacterium]|jgi:hypothetical protein|nr:hypothetical protein [Flavobacteriales bacterium]